MNDEIFETNDKGTKIALIVVAILVVLAVIAYFVYNTIFNNPSLKFLNFINKIKEQEVISKDEVKLSGDLTVKAKNKDFAFLENANAKYGIIVNDKTDTFMLEYEYSEKDKKILDFTSFMDDDKLYVISEQLFGTRPIYTEVDKKSDMAESDFEYIATIYGKALASSFKAEKAIKSEKKVTINNDTIKVRDNKFIVTKENVDRINNTFKKSLLNDDKAITILAKYSSKTKEEIKKEIEKEYGIVGVEDVNSGNYYFSIYTKGLFNSFIGFGFGQENKDSIEYFIYNDYNLLTIDTGEEAILIVEGKIDSLKYRLTDGKDELLFGNIVKYSDNNYAVTMEMKDCFELKFTLKEDKDLKIEKAIPEGAINVDELKDEDYVKFEENYEKLLESSEVYTKLIKPMLEEEEKNE